MIIKISKWTGKEMILQREESVTTISEIINLIKWKDENVGSGAFQLIPENSYEKNILYGSQTNNSISTE